MPRPFFGSGFFPPPNEPPEDYTALLVWFGDDEGALSAWVAGWIAYSTSAEAEDILAAAQVIGTAQDTLTVLQTSAVQITPLDVYPTLDSPIYDRTAYEVPTGPIPTPVEKGVF